MSLHLNPNTSSQKFEVVFGVLFLSGKYTLFFEAESKTVDVGRVIRRGKDWTESVDFPTISRMVALRACGRGT